MPIGAVAASLEQLSRKSAMAAFFKVDPETCKFMGEKNDSDIDPTTCPSTLASSAASTPPAAQPQPQSDDEDLPTTPREAPVSGCEAFTPLEAPVPVCQADTPVLDTPVLDLTAIAGEYLDEFKQLLKSHSADVAQVVGTNTKLVAELEKALKANDVDIRSALGQKFSREHAIGSLGDTAMKKFMGEKSKQGVKTNDAKRMWRVTWAERVYDTVTEGKRHEKSWQEVAKEKGTYVCFAVLVEKMGYTFDPRGAIERARRYADKCVAMKGDWFEYNLMIEELDFFLLEKSHTHIMAEKWAMYEDQSGKRKAAIDPEKTDEKEHGGSAKKPKNGASPKDTSKDGGGHENIDKGGLAKLIAEASKVKNLLHGTTSAANSLVSNIESTQSWGWANTAHTLGQLRDKKAAVDGALNEFGKQILFTELSNLKKSVGAAFLEVELKNFVAVKGKVIELAAYHATLVKMHKEFTGTQ
jgi:hypothetical protein